MTLSFDTARCGGLYIHEPTEQGWHPECEQCARRLERVHGPRQTWMAPAVGHWDTCDARIPAYPLQLMSPMDDNTPGPTPETWQATLEAIASASRAMTAMMNLLTDLSQRVAALEQQLQDDGK